MMGHHPRMIGLGGIDRGVRMIVADSQATLQLGCTCGASSRHCPFWSAVAAKIADKAPSSLVERYQLALDTFAEVFGPEAWAVDASQIKEPLYTLSSQKWLDLRVVHLARDVRSAVVSEIDSRRRKGRRKRIAFVTALVAAMRWWRENEKLEACLRETRLRHRVLGYEEFCLGFQEAFASVCSLVDLESVPASFAVPRTNSHMFIGNRMRVQDEKSTLRYDGRWLTRNDWMAPSILLPFVLTRNRAWVYSNNIFGVFTQK